MPHRVTLAVLTAVLSIVTGPIAPVLGASCWPPPVTAPVVDPYRPPACPWCPGNRGIAYGTPPGAAVRAVAAGRVTFAGPVAGTVYVVVELANGWRVTYGNLSEPVAPGVRVGDPVVSGMVLGHTAGALHFGLRDRAGAGDGNDAYLDPTAHLGVWRHRARLIPSDGRPARASPAPVLTCPATR